MPDLSAITDAANDHYLRERFISAAAEAGIPNPQVWVDLHARQLAAAPVAVEGADTVASVYAYAVAVTPPPPGERPDAVTDTHLEYAVANLRQQETP